MTTPVITSGIILRWKPSVKRYPRLWIPTKTPTVTKLTVLTATTRNPASNTGPASGNSTEKKRPHSAYPRAVADRKACGSMLAKASATVRTMIATA